MSDTPSSGFGRFVPGFDFLQNLARGASDAMPKIPGVSNWIAPTLDIDEIDKRIAELRAVQFWLEQNGRALAATVQALEVQRMTLATLQGMDVTLTDLADSMKVKTVPAAAEKPPAAASRDKPAADVGQDPSTARPRAKPDAGPAQPVVDPMQWWSSLTQQFQEIAAGALKDMTHTNPVDATRDFASGMEQVMKAATSAAEAAGAAGKSDKSGKPGTARKTARGKTTEAKAKTRKATPRKSGTARSSS